MSPVRSLRYRLLMCRFLGRLHHKSIHALPRQASEKRQGTKSRAFNQRRMQLGPERFERNYRGNRYKRIVLFGETFIASVQIEEAKLSHANPPRSEYDNLESDLRGGGKRLFFEVPRTRDLSL